MLSSKPRQAPRVLTATTIPTQAADTPRSMEAPLFRRWPHRCPSDPTAMPLHRLTSMRHCMMDRDPRCRCTVLMVPGKDCHFFHTAERTGRNRTGPTQINQDDDGTTLHNSQLASIEQFFTTLWRRLERLTVCALITSLRSSNGQEVFGKSYTLSTAHNHHRLVCPR